MHRHRAADERSLRERPKTLYHHLRFQLGMDATCNRVTASTSVGLSFRTRSPATAARSPSARSLEVFFADFRHGMTLASGASGSRRIDVAESPWSVLFINDAAKHGYMVSLQHRGRSCSHAGRQLNLHAGRAVIRSLRTLMIVSLHICKMNVIPRKIPFIDILRPVSLRCASMASKRNE